MGRFDEEEEERHKKMKEAQDEFLKYMKNINKQIENPPQFMTLDKSSLEQLPNRYHMEFLLTKEEILRVMDALEPSKKL